MKFNLWRIIGMAGFAGSIVFWIFWTDAEITASQYRVRPGNEFFGAMSYLCFAAFVVSIFRVAKSNR